MKRFAIVLVIVVLGLLVWVMLRSSDISIIVNGQKLVGPAKLAAEGWGLLVAIVALFCAAILLAFVFAGAALIVLGVLVLAGLVAAWLAFPFLLPLLIPLFLVWIFVAAVRHKGKSVKPPLPSFRTQLRNRIRWRFPPPWHHGRPCQPGRDTTRHAPITRSPLAFAATANATS